MKHFSREQLAMWKEEDKLATVEAAKAREAAEEARRVNTLEESRRARLAERAKARDAAKLPAPAPEPLTDGQFVMGSLFGSSRK